MKEYFVRSGGAKTSALEIELANGLVGAGKGPINIEVVRFVDRGILVEGGGIFFIGRTFTTGLARWCAQVIVSWCSNYGESERNDFSWRLS